MHLDAVEIGAMDLPRASRDFALLLQVEPVSSSATRVRFELTAGAVQLVQAPDGMRGLRLSGAPPALAGWGGARAAAGLPITWLEAGEADLLEGPSSVAASAGCPSAIDHVVVNTLDPERAIQIWGERLGMRLALDRVFAGRGLRLQFFRTSNRVTLEFASPHPPATAGSSSDDRLHGVSFRVADLRGRHATLRAAGFDVSDIRDGMKPGTLVCTVRDRTCGVPTLLIQQPPRTATIQA